MIRQSEPPIPRRGVASTPRIPIEIIARELAGQFGFDPFVVVSKMDFLDLQVMVLPEDRRGRGIGTAFMTKLCAEADRLGKVIGGLS